VGTDLVDDILLEVPAAMRLEADDRGIPTGSVPVDRSPYDFRQATRIGDLDLDTAFTDIVGTEAVLASPDGRRRVRVWWDDSHRC